MRLIKALLLQIGRPSQILNYQVVIQLIVKPDISQILMFNSLKSKIEISH